MGNQSPPLIPPNYPEFAHHSLATAKLTKHQNKLEILFEQGPSTQIYTHWKTHLNSLPLPNKYLFLPELENREDVVDLCCNSDALYRFDSYAAVLFFLHRPYISPMFTPFNDKYELENTIIGISGNTKSGSFWKQQYWHWEIGKMHFKFPLVKLYPPMLSWTMQAK